MIQLKHILNEISKDESVRLLNKIKNKDFTFFASGDNGKVYQLNNEDLLVKITSEPDETAVADVIVGRYGEFNAFIPVHYSDSKRRMYIMNKADKLNPGAKHQIETFYENYKEFARQQGGETSIFDYLNADGARNLDPKIVSFLRALEQQVKKTGIGDLDLSLDFKPDNIMSWNGNLVMIDW
jgi:hypothetical protein